MRIIIIGLLFLVIIILVINNYPQETINGLHFKYCKNIGYYGYAPGNKLFPETHYCKKFDGADANFFTINEEEFEKWRNKI